MDKFRAMPVVVNGCVKVVRTEPQSASEVPLDFDELIFHAMADEIERLRGALKVLCSEVDVYSLDCSRMILSALTPSVKVTGEDDE